MTARRLAGTTVATHAQTPMKTVQAKGGIR